MAVDTPSADYNLFLADRQMTHSLRGGTRAMRSAGQVYLPQEPLETPVAYEARLKRSVLTNFYSKSGDIFSGKITRKDPVLLEGTPQEIKDLEEDIDHQGNSISQFTQKSLEYAIDDGLVFGFVDTPRAPLSATGDDDPEAPPRTRAQDAQMGIRPYVSMVPCDRMIGWTWEMRNGKPTLTSARIMEYVMEPDPDDPWNQEEVQQIRVVLPFQHQLWRKMKDDDGKEDWFLVETISTEFEEIPIVPLYTNRKKFMVAEPLFVDLANLNIAHWQSDSDQTNIVHTIRMPILFGTGLQENDEDVILSVGPNSVVVGEPGSDLKYVEHTGKAAESGFKALERLETNITRLGADIILNRRTGGPTATARALDQAEADTEMAIISTNVEDWWRELFRHFMIAFGQEIPDDMTDIGINMNKDYNLGMWDVSAIQDLLSMRTTGDLSQDTLWEEMKRIGILSEDFDPEEEKALLEEEKTANMDREVEMMRSMGQVEADPFSDSPTPPADDDDDADE